MKKVISIAVFPVMFFSLVLFSGCDLLNGDEDVAGDDDSAPVVVENDFFKLEVPVGWSESAPPTGVINMFYKDADSGDPRAKLINFQDSFSVALDSKTNLGEDYMGGIKETLVAVLPGATYTDDECFQVGGHEACSVEIALVQNEIELRMSMVAIEGYGSDIWLLTLTSTEIDFDDSLSDFEGVLDSFELYVVE